MSNMDREPVELIELILPRCINTYGSGLCTASGSGDGKCYNTRATCQDVTNYRDTPDRHLTPDLVRGDREEIAITDVTRTADLFAGFEVRFGTTPDGIIWEQGGSGTGIWLGVNSGNLIFAGGGPDWEISVDASGYAGKSMIVYVELDFVISGASSSSLWIFDPVELTNTLLGTAAFIGSAGEWAGGSPGAIGRVDDTATVVSGYNSNDWNGGITIARFYDSTAAPTVMLADYNQSLWIGRGDKGEPIDEQYILPCLSDIGSVGTRINLAGSDDNYEPLGRRSWLSFQCADFAHSDITQDPYLTDRESDPRTKSTFWRKWLQRQKFGKVGALVRVYDGYADQMIADYSTRTYILDKVNFNADGASFSCRDVLTRTEFLKAQVPVPSSGILLLDLTDVATAFSLVGDVTEDYPASGTVRINDEIITYSARAVSGNDTDFTVAAGGRGTDGSTADEHESGDLVQLCRRYTDATVSEVLTEFLCDDAKIEGQLVNLAGIESEDAAYLNAYQLTTLLTEPFAVSDLIGRMSQECGFYIWWDERTQRIELQAIRAVGFNELDTLWTHEDNIVADSFKVMERPKQRLNIINFYYNPIDWSGELQKATNFTNGLKVVNGTTSLPEQYGNLLQTRDIFSIFLTTEAEANQTSSRLAIRYADVPQECEVYVDAKDRATWVGDIVQISTPMIVNSNGDRVVRRWLVIEAEEVDPGHLARYVCTDITLDGSIYLITENGIGNYTAALLAEGNAFITDAFGLNSDGTAGATIA